MEKFKGTKLKLHKDCFKNEYNFYVQPISTSRSSNILFANTYGKTEKQAISNAQLISCAPEMLEELIHTKKLLKCIVSSATKPAIERIEQLIKKATEL